MSYETYYIPANFTDAGRVFGLFEIRNVIEAAVLGLPVLFLSFTFLPFALTTRIIMTLIIFVPVAGFALIGISDDSLSRFMKTWLGWRKKRRIITYRGESNYSEFKAAYAPLCLLAEIFAADKSVRYLSIEQPILDAAFGKDFSLYSMDKTNDALEGGM